MAVRFANQGVSRCMTPLYYLTRDQTAVLQTDYTRDRALDPRFYTERSKAYEALKAVVVERLDRDAAILLAVLRELTR